MKVGILTFHYAYNYGAVLQAYATQKLLENLGHTPEFINYQNKRTVWNYKRLHFRWNLDVLKKPTLSISNFLRTKRQLFKEKKYDEFISHRLNVAPTLYKEGSKIDASKYDMVLIGSDQVWNPTLTGGMDDVYWGNLGKGETKIVAWSPSSLNLDYTQNDLEKIKNALCNFYSLSVRDESLKKIIEKLTDKNISITLDPTFLLDKKDWIELCHEVPEKNYILVYAVRHFDKTLKIANSIANSLHKKLIVVRSIVNPIHHSYDRDTCSPEDFLSYIYHADLVVASSFHGTAFSIIFEKKFVNFVPESSKDSRVLTILKALNLGERAVNEKSNYTIIETMPNYKRAKEELTILREKTIAYFKSSF